MKKNKHFSVLLTIVPLILFSSCDNNTPLSMDEVSINKFLLKYDEKYPNGYDFENGFYQVESLETKYSSQVLDVEIKKLSADLTFYNNSAEIYPKSFSLFKSSVSNSLSETPSKNKYEAFWDGSNYYEEKSTLKYPPSGGAAYEWVSASKGSDALDNVYLSINYFSIREMVAFIRRYADYREHLSIIARYYDNTLSIINKYGLITITRTLIFDDNFSFVQFQRRYFVDHGIEKDQYSDSLLSVSRLNDFGVTVPKEYDDEYLLPVGKYYISF